jgi:hypothetical protein
MERPVSELMALLAPSSTLNVPVGFPLPWEVQTTYRVMLSFFKRSYHDGFELPQPPAPIVIPPPTTPYPTLNWGDLTMAVNPNSPLDQQLLQIVADVVNDLTLITNWVGGILNDVGQWIASITSQGTLWLRQDLYNSGTLRLWRTVRAHRDLLVHLGYLIPQDQEVRADGSLMHGSEIDVRLIQLGNTGRNPKDRRYSYLPIVGEHSRPWAYPDMLNDGATHNALEQARVLSGPYLSGAFPDVLLRTDGSASNDVRVRYEQAQSPRDTDILNEQFVGHDGSNGTTPLGDPVLFSAYLIGRLRAGSPYGSTFGVDYNMDSDRGYAYQCWDWNRDPSTSVPGYHGRTYNVPCTWPESSTNFQQGSALQLHAKRVPDPHCAALTLVATAQPVNAPLGIQTQMYVRAYDHSTGLAVDGVVVVDNQDVARTNTTFAYTFTNLGSAVLVCAPEYPDTAVYVNIYTPQLQVSVQPTSIPLFSPSFGTPPAGGQVQLLVQALDTVTNQPVAGTVNVDGKVIGPTNTVIPYTFVMHMQRVIDPTTRPPSWTTQEVAPAGQAAAQGYPSVDLAFNFWNVTLLSAAYVAQNVPSALAAGQSASASVTMQNNGALPWLAAGTTPFRLGSQNPQDNTIWGLGRVGLTSDVPFGGTATFNFTIVAPSQAQAAAYSFCWQMVEETLQWFGPLTPTVSVQVAAKPKDTKETKEKDKDKDTKDHKELRDNPTGTAAMLSHPSAEAGPTPPDAPASGSRRTFIAPEERPSVGSAALAVDADLA